MTAAPACSSRCADGAAGRPSPLWCAGAAQVCRPGDSPAADSAMGRAGVAEQGGLPGCTFREMRSRREIPVGPRHTEPERIRTGRYSATTPQFGAGKRPRFAGPATATNLPELGPVEDTVTAAAADAACCGRVGRVSACRSPSRRRSSSSTNCDERGHELERGHGLVFVDRSDGRSDSDRCTGSIFAVLQ